MLLSNLNLLATAPGGVARLRELILTLSVQGKLVPQDTSDEPASKLLKKIRAEKDRLIAEGKIKRDKPLAEIAEEEKPFALPVSWKWVRALDICALITDGDHQPPPKADTGVPFLVIGDVRTGEVHLQGASRFVSESYFEELDWGKKPCLGDVLYTTVGSFGIPVPVIQQQRFCFQRHIALFRPAAIELQSFMALALRTKLAFQQAEKGATGIAQKTVPLSALRDLMLPLPPLAEQSRIVTRVEELMRLCDALEAKGQLQAAQHAQLVSTLLGTLTQSETPVQLAENWHRIATHFDLLLDRPKAVDALEQTILQLAVRGLLVPQNPQDEPASKLLKKIRAEKDKLIAEGKIKRDKPLPPIGEDEQPFALSQGWEWVRLDEIADNRLGKMLDKAKNTGKRYPYLRNTNVQWRHIDLDDIKEISLEASELEEFRLLPGDLLICEGGYPGRCAIWNEPDREMYFQKALHRVRPRGGIAAELIAISLESDSKSGSLEQHFTGATIKHFVGQALGRYLIPLPPLAEQSRIVTRLAQLRRLCFELRQRLESARQTQQALALELVEQAA
jgi:type I restriction enzyme, S subunit